MRHQGLAFDGLIRSETGATVAIEIKANSKPIGSGGLAMFIGTFHNARDNGEISRVLFVSMTGLTPRALQQLERDAGFIRHVVIQGVQDQPRLQRAIEQAFEL